jgi:ubiquinone/menaquinone biosynthesis C-methylase UbiE
VADPQFRNDLFTGTASAYDKYRLPYPQALIDDLASRTGASGAGVLLDLACGTGQLSFALQDKFRQIRSVDQEPEMIAVVRAKALAAGVSWLSTDAGAAERLSVPPRSVDLIAVGNAFHRLPRQTVAARSLRWLRPGGYLALAWGGSPWDGSAPWQLAMTELMQRWRARAEAASGEAHRVPPTYEQTRAETSDAAILAAAGFELIGRWEFRVVHDWTPDEVLGHCASTSVLSARALGDLAPGFEADLRREFAATGRLRQDVSFAYELARRPC